jgi:WD40 repeat protein
MMSVSRNGLVVSGAHDHSLHVWHMKTGADLQTLIGRTNDVTAVAISADGRRVVSSSHDRTLRVWDVPSGEPILILDQQQRPTLAVELVIDSEHRWIVHGAGNGNLKVRSLESGAVIAETWFDAPVRCCAFAGNNTIVAGDGSGNFHVLSLEPAATDDYGMNER